jgi:hypothetical protein
MSELSAATRTVFKRFFYRTPVLTVASLLPSFLIPSQLFLVFDSSSKFPVGLLFGNFYQLGNFDECIGLRQPVSNLNEVPLRGKYCLADIELFNTKQYDGRVARSFETIKVIKPPHLTPTVDGSCRRSRDTCITAPCTGAYASRRLVQSKRSRSWSGRCSFWRRSRRV